MLISQKPMIGNLTGVGSVEFVYKRVLYTDNRARLVLVDMKVFNMLSHGASKSFILRIYCN